MIHSESHTEQSHTNAPIAFCISTELISCFNKFKIFEIPLFTISACIRGIHPSVVSRTGNACKIAEFFHTKRRLCHGFLLDQCKEFAGWDVLSYFCRLRTCEVFFKNSTRSEEHTSELQSRFDLVCRLLLEKKKQCHSY